MELNYSDETMLRKFAKRLKSLMYDNLDQTLAVLEKSNLSDEEKEENEEWFREFDKTTHSRGDELREDGRRIMSRLSSREKKIKKLKRKPKKPELSRQRRRLLKLGKDTDPPITWKEIKKMPLSEVIREIEAIEEARGME